jgi:SHS family lactate transporter-like MFS transporter
MSSTTMDRPWYRQVNADQWRAFWAAYLGWMLDGFDFSILAFVLVDVQRSFSVDNALAGALLSIGALFRVVGGASAGAAADRWGRKGPLMFSILIYSVLTFLSGFSTTYRVLFACRALFGIGMGGVWAAGMPLALEHWPTHLRGLASGLLQGGYAMGYMLMALVYQILHPIFSTRGELAWRGFFWIGILPALLALWIMWRVKESPVWLERQAQTGARRQDTASFASLFQRRLLPAVIHSTLLMGAMLFLYNSIVYLYPTLLIRDLKRPTLPFVVAFNIGGILGAIAFGRLSETKLGRRGAMGLATLVGMATIPLYLFGASGAVLASGALLMGLFGTGNFGVTPTYLSERFPTAVRAAGAGFTYQAGAALAALAPTVIGVLQDRGMPLASAMAVCIAASGTALLVLLAFGPETRGRELRE